METTIVENQMEKKMENEMETGIILGESKDFCTFFLLLWIGSSDINLPEEIRTTKAIIFQQLAW